MGWTTKARMSTFRKIALSAWNSGGDPSVYGFLEIDVTDAKIIGSPMPAIIQAMAATMKKHKEVNAIMRFGRIYHRNTVDISVLVNIPEAKSHDLSIATLYDVDKMSAEDIGKKLFSTADLVRKKKDPQLGFALKLIRWMPQMFIWLLLNSFSFIVHDLGWNLSWLKLPKKPFGPVLVTNVGSLGINKVLVPLVPWTRALLLVSVGKIVKEPKVVNDQIVIRNIMHLGVTFDHRFFDGSHAAVMIRDFESNFTEFTT